MNRGRASQRWPREVLRTSIDLLAVLVLVGLANLVVFLPVGDGSPLRAVVGLVFVLFLPGYALVSLLFPEAGRSPARGESDEPGSTIDRFFVLDRTRAARGIDGVERVALAFALSLALVPLILVGVSVSAFEFALVPTFLAISAVTVVCAGVALLRRWEVPEDERFRVPYRAWIATGTGSITDAGSRFDAVLNVALAVAIVLAVGTLAFAVVVPPDGERFTEFYVLNGTGDGELVASNYPESLSPDEPELLYVGIENYEQGTVEYSVVVQLQRVEGDTDESIVADRVEVDRFSMTLGPNETSIRAQELTVSDELTGEGLRLTFLLYDGSVPDTPTRDNAYRSLHLWIDVEAVAE